MNSNSNPKTTQAQNPQDYIVARLANKAEMLKRLDEIYDLGNELYEQVGETIDIVCDKRKAIEAFQGTDDFSMTQVDEIYQSLEMALASLNREQS